MQPPKKPRFFSNIINVILVLGIPVTFIGLAANFFLRPYIAKQGYAGLTEAKVLSIDQLGTYTMQENNYVKLTDFCLDEDEYQLDAIGSDEIFFYAFLNNKCDGENGTLVVVEMDEKTFDQYASIPDEELNDFFTGQLFSGTQECEAASFRLKELMDEGTAFTLKAGFTPQRAFEKEMKEINQLGIFMAAILVAIIIALIIFNTYLRKKYKKEMDLYSKNNPVS